MKSKDKKGTAIQKVKIWDEDYFMIANMDELRPFFMSIVSDGNHWMFISSTGGLSAGRKNAGYALFPYYTDDKITESANVTGSKSIFRVLKDNTYHIWEPFSDRYEGIHKVSRNLYKNVYGNKVIFEEINHDLGLTFRYSWNSSAKYGFVKKATISNHSGNRLEVSALDGIQNIVPYGVHNDLQNGFSNLVDAYKRNELVVDSGVGIFALSAIIVDRAEPSEALKANVAWSMGMDNPTHLVSSLQLKNFRRGKELKEETDVKAERGAYFIHSNIILPAGEEKSWFIVAEVNQNHAGIAKINHAIKNQADLHDSVMADIEAGTKKLIGLVAASDGIQHSSDHLRDTRHFANTMFNIMRGGIFDFNYDIEKKDFLDYLSKANKSVYAEFKGKLESLSEVFPASKLKELAKDCGNAHLARLSMEYMPLKFSRRHGDPSRPWNKFSINTVNEEDGSKILDYEGNWRDIFQNWEALSRSYPQFLSSMIHKFLNASTFDGYNPYRVTKGGFDWEAIEPDDPWSYIGYWGDHQIIYLLKFLELLDAHAPEKLEQYFGEDMFVYANVPYKIKDHSAILSNPKDTIDFDFEADEHIRAERDKRGADGALIFNAKGEIHTVNFVEKILASLLAKLSNFIPEAGIWLNTQRPEWNDANNALVGNGVSMVTLYYIRRFVTFFKQAIGKSDLSEVTVSAELHSLYSAIKDAFKENESLTQGKINDKQRKTFLDALGNAASNYRNGIYATSFTGNKEMVSLKEIENFLDSCLLHIEHTIRANKRTDDLYHAYNLMTVENEDEVSVSYLSEMLEGQVAVLSSGYLSSKESLEVLDGMKASALFRPDQYSYILYPNKDLPGFMEKNNIPKSAVEQSILLMSMLRDGDKRIINQDIEGKFHFNGLFNNANNVAEVLDTIIASDGPYTAMARKERARILGIFESVFVHKEFTGRSGTFFGYEGLGSIYWHMVSKLQLAVMEVCLKAIEEEESPETIGRLLEHYYEINEGIGVHKDPSLYGAFPTDPYSHTPAGKGAQQPGMTGQVKEDILSRFGELGVFVKDGKLYFYPCMLRKNEFLSKEEICGYIDVNGEEKQLHLPKDSLCFTYCQVPVIYQLSDNNSMEISFTDGTKKSIDSLVLDKETSAKIFGRTGEVLSISASVSRSVLK